MSDAVNEATRWLLRDGGALRSTIAGSIMSGLVDEIARLRITDAEREAVERAAVWMMTLARDRREIQSAVYLADDAATLRGLRERHAP